jgi:hypothetical protein
MKLNELYNNMNTSLKPGGTTTHNGERIRAGYPALQALCEVDASEISRDEYHWLNVFPAKRYLRIL